MKQNKFLYKKDKTRQNTTKKNKMFQDILQKDRDGSHVITQKKEKQELFGLIKDNYYRGKGGVTIKEMRQILAELKYDNDNHFSRKEVDRIARELGPEIGPIREKYYPKSRRKSVDKKMSKKLKRKPHPFSFGTHLSGGNKLNSLVHKTGNRAQDRMSETMERIKKQEQNEKSGSMHGRKYSSGVSDPYANLSSGNKGDSLKNSAYSSGTKSGLGSSSASLRGRGLSR